MCGARCGSVAAVVARGGVAWKAAGVWLEEEAPLTLLEAAVTGERGRLKLAGKRGRG